MCQASSGNDMAGRCLCQERQARHSMNTCLFDPPSAPDMWWSGNRLCVKQCPFQKCHEYGEVWGTCLALNISVPLSHRCGCFMRFGNCEINVCFYYDLGNDLYGREFVAFVLKFTQNDIKFN